ncbi:MAG: 30S ribosomal protein S20 [Candidatus Omnitrophica bacterium CG12_big_fil_rev_8_21_14_0_65_43_15]|uniref:Small ribosomal subunit protein bS20 n=1 Tax=Candidatus Taenaricola geysiri TaxID=1974752 RepID=A0A2J0LDB3_9BACT|nr:MAG: 30S ribosomal protein S20 [Candidatus Omnitrophica bacterium CG1_02_43_210]PIR65352.1 MAG: 30S ribosomal protein S20 [Candidatus Omnitrophica bacterium CG10_big_fil_rev_8_21_14_0_10_43_8]PIV12189.1 MAG: 30S ribosomal protein S20 [Candidatus Omnitrophica bacterium CG03_land_8_20_14_0_80_43_22]PIW65848.1 MAG: 30S ribosomal protein S20 [Candidatus Omnitrophica bacterium CG12_big_fil_rev_8_21_14_0_65_43_15]PIW80117.1 MAG: 30S ribosomal protein S20 [Candidatus Omnitrophica bacterium CG_4_8_1
MPIKKSAWKELRKSERRRQRNMSIKSEFRTLLRKMEKFISSSNKTEALTLYKILASKLDKAASNKIIHKNTASRNKSRYMKKISKLA